MTMKLPDGFTFLKHTSAVMGVVETNDLEVLGKTLTATDLVMKNEGEMSIRDETNYLINRIDECIQNIGGDIYYSDIVTIAVSLGIETEIVFDYVSNLGLKIKE